MKRNLGFAVAVLTAVPVLASCGRSASGETNGSLEYAVAERRDMEIRAEATGLIEPIRLVEVKSKASGEVLRIHVETGDEVKRGTLLAEIDPRDVRNAFEQAQADLEVAKARLATSVAQKERVEELRKARVATEQEFEGAALDEANSRAQLIKAQTNLELARERLTDVTIRAPSDGTIISRTVEEGQIIASASQTVSGGTTLVLMADLAEMQVRALVDETDLGRIQPGLMTRVTVEAYPERAFEGRVLKIEPQAVVEQNVTMFPVIVRLDNRDRLLKPGMNASVIFEIAHRSDIVAVPNAAIINVRDAVTAGAVLGLDEQTINNALRGGPVRLAAASPSAAADGASTESPETGSPAGAATATDATTAAPADECATLFQRVREGGGFQSLSEQERAKLRECRPAGSPGGGFRGAGGPGGARASGAQSNLRPAVVFVAGTNGVPEARRVMLGVNDFDYSEVVSGLEAGERVVLVSVARLQAAQQEFNARMRERASGAFTGGAAAPGGRR